MAENSRLNQYTCDKCNRTITTIDRDEGATPMMLGCRFGCGGRMMSHWYKVEENLTPDYEWVKPKSLKGYSREMKDHIRSGGLDLRALAVEG